MPDSTPGARAGAATVTLRDSDAFYNALIELHERMSPEQSQMFNARLILLLAQHLGDDAVLQALLRAAATGLVRPEER